MKVRRFVLRLIAGTAPLVAALSIAAPPSTLAAVPPILVDDVTTADNCGKYDGKPAVTDLVAAINGAVTGTTVTICPGTYTLSGVITVIDKKLTVKRAVTGANSRPVLDIDDTAVSGMDIQTSNVTIDGLVLDGRGNPAEYAGISLITSPAIIRNTTILGPDQEGSAGVYADASGSEKLVSLSISNTTIAGYQDIGVFSLGAVKLNLSSSHLDASDGGRVRTDTSEGIWLDGEAPGPLGPTGMVTKSRIFNHGTGILITDSSKVRVTNNLLADNETSVVVTVSSDRNSDNNKIIGNTILGIPAGGEGVLIVNQDAANLTINKFSVSKNMFVADQYGSGVAGVLISSDVAATLAITGSITSNTFVGITNYFDPVNGPYAGMTEKGNDVQP